MKQFTCISDLLGLPVLCLGNNIHILVELELTNERLPLHVLFQTVWLNFRVLIVLAAADDRESMSRFVFITQ